MAGIVQTGISYQNRALSGFVRDSEQQQEIARANEEISARERSSKKSNQATMLAVGGLGGYVAGGASAAMAAQFGTAWAGPVGMVAGAAIGYIFGSLF